MRKISEKIICDNCKEKIDPEFVYQIVFPFLGYQSFKKSL